ncbi:MULTISPECIES: intradiol ring-cleavage dioxygenase [Subtercola]|uniref:3,4-dioxygenase subunit beta n=1 Tax=Subtercola vilae TaxID=2056433 RepID=A0A4T2BVL7_9MICO|nr:MULTISPECIES: intradiol ring-cleavage dioxygenase [Subtercola]MEA9985207.1 intradiol ring-cleavage dioxygenase [Subtercola sp. RTI3]TIH34571.1 3,4-dioxygenase subunit beta [Subtercola vilae]
MTENTTDRQWLDAQGDPIDEEDRGLVYDVRTLVNRRNVLGLFGGIATASLLAACSTPTSAASGATASANASATASATAAATASATATTAGDVTEVPDETAGPYPGDGSNGVDVLGDSGIVRSDIRSSFGSSTTTAPGVPLTIQLGVRDASTGAALTGAAVYLWHCDRDGAYSLYSKGITSENYLRGVQAVDASGIVTFTSIFPACYSGRWPHIHFEVYANVATAVASGPIVKTSQIAMPKETCDVVYATSGYAQSVKNLASVSLSTDNVFSDDGAIHQIATVSGSVDAGFTAALTVGV